MKFLRSWAPLMLASVAPLCLVPPGNAQTQTIASVIEDWSNPGSFPFKGNFNDVCRLYAADLTDEQCLRALSQYEKDATVTDAADKVGTVMYLQDGDILQVSFTVGGVHKQKTLRVAFGADVPADDPKRRALVYDMGRSDGVKLVRPDICGNWSIMTIAPPEPEPVIITRLVERPMQVCEIPGATSIVTPGVFLPGFHPPGCNCGLHVPGLFVGSETLLTEGSPVCYTTYPTTEGD